jgi:hypothetical protein
MPCEVLIKARTTHGPYSKGTIAGVKDQPCVWGSKEGLPYSIRVIIPDATRAQILAYTGKWKLEYDYEVVTHNLPQDGYRIRVFSKYPSVSGACSITREQVENYLIHWGATYKSASQNEVVFDFTVYKSAISNGVWGNTLFIGFTEVSYNQSTGVHVVDADYSAITPTPNPAKIEGQVIGKGGLIVSHDAENKIVRFSFDRTLVTARLKRAIHDRLSQTFEAHQYYIDNDFIDDVVSQGGEVTVNISEMLTYVKNRLDE